MTEGVYILELSEPESNRKGATPDKYRNVEVIMVWMIDEARTVDGTKRIPTPTQVGGQSALGELGDIVVDQAVKASLDAGDAIFSRFNVPGIPEHATPQEISDTLRNKWQQAADKGIRQREKRRHELAGTFIDMGTAARP